MDIIKQNIDIQLKLQEAMALLAESQDVNKRLITYTNKLEEQYKSILLDYQEQERIMLRGAK
jgi:hypothetical protein